MSIERYCKKTAKPFFYPTERGLLKISYLEDHERWLLIYDNIIETDLTYEQLVERIKHIPGILQYI